MKENDLYLKAVSKFSGSRILVIGDLMLDIYLKGTSTRLCPEAPVPVVDVQINEIFPGGAANSVCNLRALGAQVEFCSVVGDDAEGIEAKSLLADLGIDPEKLVVQQGRRTIKKSRVVAGSQILARIDEGSEDPIDDATAEALLKHIRRVYDWCDAILISDYNKGVITNKVIEGLAELQRDKQLLLAVDSKRLTFFSALQPTLAKPNYDECLGILGIERQADRLSQITTHAAELFAKCHSRVIAATLDSEGTLLVENGKVSDVIPSPAVKKAYVAGAGDTYISALLLAYLHSQHAHRAAMIATAAAFIAINKENTSSCSQAELKSYFNTSMKYISDLTDLDQVCESYRRAGKKIVFTNGCFDILHSGHVAYLHRAKQLGDVLIVGLNRDESIRRIKGNDRPINGLSDRLQVLAGLSSVDHIFPFGNESDDTPVPVIKIVRPDVFVKGGDYTKENLPEAQTVEACGGEIVFIDHVPNHSTTRIITRITQNRKKKGPKVPMLRR